MDRRRFLGLSLAGAAAPALPLRFVPAAATAGVPNAARFWAIYLSHLHGTCTPQMLGSALSIPAHRAQPILSKLLADGVIKQTGIPAGKILQHQAQKAVVATRSALSRLHAHIARHERAPQRMPVPHDQPR